MKRTIATILVLTLCLGFFAACSSDEEAQQSEDEGNAQSIRQSYTAQEAAEINGQIDESAINLVQFQEVKAGDVVATINTSAGEIVFVLYPDLAPQTVENFVQLAQEGYYNGKVFHRVVSELLIQTGALESDGTGGKSIYTDENGDMLYIPNEYSSDLWHFRGAVSMANTGKDQNLSQFFIVQTEEVDEDTLVQMEEINFPGKVIERYKEVGGAPAFDGNYTVFGMVLEGMDVVDFISSLPVDEDTNRPIGDVVIETITIETLD